MNLTIQSLHHLGFVQLQVKSQINVLPAALTIMFPGITATGVAATLQVNLHMLLSISD
jgi:hypothetical protein